jgi:DNA replication protein DnaC
MDPRNSRYRNLGHFWQSNIGQLIAFYMWQENIKLVHYALPKRIYPNLKMSRKFDMSQLRANNNLVFIGKKGTGKTILFFDDLYKLL